MILLPDKLRLISEISRYISRHMLKHYGDVIMGTMTSQITSLTIVYSTVYSGADQRKHQSSASLAFVRGIHRGPVNAPHKWPVTRKMFPFDDVIMRSVLVMCYCGLIESTLTHTHQVYITGTRATKPTKTNPCVYFRRYNVGRHDGCRCSDTRNDYSHWSQSDFEMKKSDPYSALKWQQGDVKGK